MFKTRKKRSKVAGVLRKLASILVVILFFFSTHIFLLAQPDKMSGFSSPVFAAGFKEFTQDDWTGGVDGGPHVVNWTSDNWNKYAEASNVNLSGGDIEATAGGASLVSSIFDLGSTERVNSPSYSFSDGGVSLLVRGANTSGGVSSAPWVNTESACTLGYRYIQYKVTFTTSGLIFYYVNFGNTSLSINGTVKNSVTGADIEGATVKVNENSVTTTNQERQGKSGPYTSFYASWVYHVGDAASYTVTASKSGYSSQTKTANYNIGSCTTWSSLGFSLTPPSSSGGSSSSSDNETSNEVPTTTTTSITKVTLPSIFTKKGSKTTDLSKISDPKKVENLTLDVVGKSKIIFKETIDLSAKKTIAAFEKLNKYLVVGTGYVDLNSKILSALNKKATIIMYKLKHTFTPEILIDGKKDTKRVISSIDYSEKNGTLDFDVAHFSKFEAAVKFLILYPTSNSVSEPNTEIKAKISDPAAVVTGSFNGVKLAKITPDKETGEFTLKDLTFNKGGNVLKLNAESKIGKVAPLATKFTYGKTETTTEKATRTLSLTILLIGSLVVLIVAIIVVYFIYKNKKSLLKLASGQKDQPPTQ